MLIFVGYFQPQKPLHTGGNGKNSIFNRTDTLSWKNTPIFREEINPSIIKNFLLEEVYGALGGIRTPDLLVRRNCPHHNFFWQFSTIITFATIFGAFVKEAKHTKNQFHSTNITQKFYGLLKYKTYKELVHSKLALWVKNTNNTKYTGLFI